MAQNLQANEQRELVRDFLRFAEIVMSAQQWFAGGGLAKIPDSAAG
jgi:hypothetical protein